MSHPNPERAERVENKCARCGVDHWRAMLNALTSIFDYIGGDIQTIKNTAYRAIPNTECQSLPDTATRMRDRCVKRVKNAIHDLSRTAIAAEQNAKEIDLLIRLREELKSLTLEGEEKQ